MKHPSLKLIKTAYQVSQLLKLIAPVAVFLGRSNVGKSSLLNAISHSKLAQVSKQPGKTRSANYYRYGKQLTILDVPGFGYAKRSLKERSEWGKLMEKLLATLPRGSLAYLLIDAKREFEQEEEELIQFLQQQGHRIHILLTKCDRFKQAERHQKQAYWKHCFEKMGDLSFDMVSAKSGEGIKTLQKELWELQA